MTSRTAPSHRGGRNNPARTTTGRKADQGIAAGRLNTRASTSTATRTRTKAATPGKSRTIKLSRLDRRWAVERLRRANRWARVLTVRTVRLDRPKPSGLVPRS